jgi:hypothetical protein
LEDRDDDAVGGADRDQVQQRGLHRQERAAEAGQQQHERGEHDHPDDDRQPRGDDVAEIELRGGRAGDVALRAAAVQRAGQRRVAQRAEQRVGGGVLRSGRRDHRGQQHLAVRAGGDRADLGHVGGLLQG